MRGRPFVQHGGGMSWGLLESPESGSAGGSVSDRRPGPPSPVSEDTQMMDYSICVLDSLTSHLEKNEV